MISIIQDDNSSCGTCADDSQKREPLAVEQNCCALEDTPGIANSVARRCRVQSQGNGRLGDLNGARFGSRMAEFAKDCGGKA